MIPQEEADLAEVLRVLNPKLFYNRSLVDARQIIEGMKEKGWTFQQQPSSLGLRVL